MKKTYEKPQIMFDNFELSQDIAAGCKIIIANQAENECGYPTRNGDLFTTEISGCTYKQPDLYDGICYHVPVDTSNLFNS